MINLQEELSQIPRWVAWDLTYDLRKIPIDPNSGRWARVNDPTTWSTFRKARGFALHHGLFGQGFVFSEDDNIFGIDLDGCRDPETGEIDQWAKEIVDALPTFTEVSPSGTGLHLYAKTDISLKGSRRAVDKREGDPKFRGWEIYSSGRYFCYTSNRISETRELTNFSEADLLPFFAQAIEGGELWMR